MCKNKRTRSEKYDLTLPIRDAFSLFKAISTKTFRVSSQLTR